MAHPSDPDLRTESAQLIDPPPGTLTATSTPGLAPESMAKPRSLLLPSLLLSFPQSTSPTSTDMGTSTGSDTHPEKEGLTSDGLLFDFRRFLEGGALDDVFGIPQDYPYTPTQNSTSGVSGWEVTKLSGGSINVTVRVSPRRGDDKLWRNPRSAVIKYAPPFVAAIGEDAPFGTFRQVIEYRALSLLGSTPSVTSPEAAYRVTIPRVLKFFECERVLALQDLGEWMKPLDSWMYPSTAESPPSCSAVGIRLGKVLASIHCDATLLLKSQTLTDEGKPWFENPDTKDFVRNEIVGKVLPILRPWIDPDTGRTEEIARIISQDFEHSFLDALYLSSSPPLGIPQLMFSMGDLWTGSIIVGASSAASSSDPGFDAVTEVDVGLIDWEFASPARIGQDIAQLSAWLYLFSTSSDWSSTEPHRHRAVLDTIATSPIPGAGPSKSGLDFGAGVSHGGAKPVRDETLGWQSAAGALLNALLVAYARKVRDYPDYAWFVDEDHEQRRYRGERLAVIRSIWILFGREVVYNVVEAKGRFVGFFAAGVDGDETEEIKMWQREMIEVGCWYVLMAGDSPDEEFEETVRRESMLRRIYTVSGPL